MTVMTGAADEHEIQAGIRSVRRIVWRKRLAIAALLVLIACIYIADRRGWLLTRRNDDLARYHGTTVRLTRIIDGDTIEVDVPDPLVQKPATRVRLWGVNAPEPAYGNRPAEPMADDAANFIGERLKSDAMTLWLESHQTRDAFGSILAHIELPDGGTLNESILEAGLAKVDERWSHALLTRYAQLENGARRRAAGIWAEKKPRSRQ